MDSWRTTATKIGARYYSRLVEQPSKKIENEFKLAKKLNGIRVNVAAAGAGSTALLWLFSAWCLISDPSTSTTIGRCGLILFGMGLITANTALQAGIQVRRRVMQYHADVRDGLAP